MYKQVKSQFRKEIIGILCLSNNAFIPFDPANTDYQAYLKWLDGYEMVGGELVKTSEGNTPLPADEA
jgi:hypothetical protein